ncbi:hypothetical protein QTO34_014122 [Cnephaeus nilssonii]|uniref:Neutral amino acid transporter 9 n=1 Tax=Cnephaeus nilssonii TaxID=3371016 RepID=A0AA40I970_CNENI|nr:hypothetical protein QTO34_014122 [Eptesicus nilssonii]
MRDECDLYAKFRNLFAVGQPGSVQPLTVFSVKGSSAAGHRGQSWAGEGSLCALPARVGGSLARRLRPPRGQDALVFCLQDVLCQASSLRRPFHVEPTNIVGASNVVQRVSDRASAMSKRIHYYSRLAAPADQALVSLWEQKEPSISDLVRRLQAPPVEAAVAGRAGPGRAGCVSFAGTLGCPRPRGPGAGGALRVQPAGLRLQTPELLRGVREEQQPRDHLHDLEYHDGDLDTQYSLGIKQAGFTTGVCVILLMGLLTLYCCYRVVRSRATIPSVDTSAWEFPDVCRHYFGAFGQWSSLLFSLVSLVGAMVVYWVLMSNFLFNTGKFMFNFIHHINDTDAALRTNDSNPVTCPSAGRGRPDNGSAVFSADATGRQQFEEWWDKSRTVPFYLVGLLLPLLSFRSPSFFSRFNVLGALRCEAGTVSVVYLTFLVTLKAARSGFHLEFHWFTPTEFFVPEIGARFPQLTGVLTLAFFIHNCVITLLKSNKNQENNVAVQGAGTVPSRARLRHEEEDGPDGKNEGARAGRALRQVTGAGSRLHTKVRDLAIAYLLVTLTYLYIGVLVFASFPSPPLSKDCIEQNFLDNFPSGDVLSSVARVFLLFQMVTVYPLLGYLARVQLLGHVFGDPYPSVFHVLVLNLIIVGAGVSMACLYPNIGGIIRYSGAACGLAFVFVYPSLIYILSLRQEDRLTWPTLVFHVLIIILGLANLVAQFFM